MDAPVIALLAGALLLLVASWRLRAALALVAAVGSLALAAASIAAASPEGTEALLVAPAAVLTGLSGGLIVVGQVVGRLLDDEDEPEAGG